MKIGDRVRNGYRIGIITNIAYDDNYDMGYQVVFDGDYYSELFYGPELHLVKDGNDILKELCSK